MQPVEGQCRAIEHHQQSGFVGVQPLEQPVQGGEAGLAVEDAIEACTQFRSTTERWVCAISFEVAIELPDQPADVSLRRPVQ